MKTTVVLWALASVLSAKSCIKHHIKVHVLGLLAVGLSAGTQVVQAVPVTISEYIFDTRTGGVAGDANNVQLNRTRVDAGGTSTTVVDDRGNTTLGYVEANSIAGIQHTVRDQNSVSDNFGYATFADYTWVHRIDWLGSIPSFSAGTLEIFTQSVNQEGVGGLPNDPVYLNLNSTFFGFLTSASPTTFTLSGVEFAYLGDGFLEVRVDPRGFSNSDNGDTITVNGSKLSLTFDPDANGVLGVPDGGATAMLLGMGLLAMWGARRRLVSAQ